MAKTSLSAFLRRVLPLIAVILLLWLFIPGGTSPGEDGSNIRHALDLQRTLKIAKVTVMVNKISEDDMIMSRALQSHQIQNDLHGYEHFVGNQLLITEASERKDRPSGAWTKIAYLLHILLIELDKSEEERLDWLFWFDADTIILNPHIRLDVFLPPATLPASTGVDPSTLHLMLVSNWNGINDGVFPIRVHPWSVALLSAVIAYPHFNPDQKLGFGDQSALNETLYTTPYFNQNWTIVPHRWFNSFPINRAFDDDHKWIYSKPMTEETFDDGGPEYNGEEASPWKVQKGDMCVHFAGSKRVRESWMGPWLDRAEQQLPEWSNGVHQTRLEVESAFFWEVAEPKRIREQENAERMTLLRPD